MKKKILIINADYYPEISENLLNGSSRVLKELNIEFEVIHVPGALEIPVILEMYKKKFSGFIIFGCVIRGATSHYDLVVNVTSSSVYKIVNKDKLPLAFSLLTVENYQQAIERSIEKKKNLGAKAAVTCMKMMKLINEKKF
tara:strand:+ start:283 stop:705 length:423 start_codon:yes stop_codon:yes gene_type:complete